MLLELEKTSLGLVETVHEHFLKRLEAQPIVWNHRGDRLNQDSPARLSKGRALPPIEPTFDFPKNNLLVPLMATPRLQLRAKVISLGGNIHHQDIFD